jgi:hypothetical protein
VLRKGVTDCDWLRSVLVGGGTGGVKSLSFLFPSPEDRSIICEGSLAAYANCVGFPLRYFAIEIPPFIPSYDWVRLDSCGVGGGGVWDTTLTGEAGYEY